MPPTDAPRCGNCKHFQVIEGSVENDGRGRCKWDADHYPLSFPYKIIRYAMLPDTTGCPYHTPKEPL